MCKRMHVQVHACKCECVHKQLCAHRDARAHLYTHVCMCTHTHERRRTPACTGHSCTDMFAPSMGAHMHSLCVCSLCTQVCLHSSPHRTFAAAFSTEISGKFLLVLLADGAGRGSSSSWHSAPAPQISSCHQVSFSCSFSD